MFVSVCVFWMRTCRKRVIWSHILDCCKGKICCSAGIFWMVTRLGCSTVYSTLESCKSLSFGNHRLFILQPFYVSVASGTHSQSHSLHEWLTDESFFVGSISVVQCLYPGASFLRREIFASVISHPHSSFTLYTCLSVTPYLALALCQMLYTPRFPTEAGSRRACPLPAPVLLREWLTSPLFSQVILWDTSTLSHTNMNFHIRPVTKDELCVYMHTHTHEHNCVYVWKTEGEREIEK